MGTPAMRFVISFFSSLLSFSLHSYYSPITALSVFTPASFTFSLSGLSLSSLSPSSDLTDRTPSDSPSLGLSLSLLTSVTLEALSTTVRTARPFFHFFVLFHHHHHHHHLSFCFPSSSTLFFSFRLMSFSFLFILPFLFQVKVYSIGVFLFFFLFSHKSPDSMPSEDA
jgi:hypothetical protein